MTDKTEVRRVEHMLALTKDGDDAFNSRDWDAMNAIHHPDMVTHVPGSGEPILGREPHEEMIAQMMRVFPDIHVFNHPYPVQFGDGDWITVVTRTTGTFLGEMVLPDGRVLPPTGKAFDVRFTKTAKWDRERIIEEFVFWDDGLQAQQIGAAG